MVAGAEPSGPRPERSPAADAFHFGLCAAGIIFCYSYSSFLQEQIVQRTEYENGEKFTYTQALVFFPFVFEVLFAWFMQPKRSQDTVPTKLYASAAASYCAAMLASNQALQYLPYPTQVLGKSCKPIPVLVFGYFFAAKRYSVRKWIYVFLIVVGVVTFFYKNKGGDRAGGGLGLGELLLLGSLALDGTTTSIQDRMKSGYKCTAMSMMLYMNFFAMCFLAVLLVFSGELFQFIGFVSRQPHVLAGLVLFGAANTAGQYFIFKTVNEFSPLSCSILTTTRKLITIVFSVLYNGHSFSGQQIVGTVIVFGALFADALDSKRKASATPSSNAKTT